MSPAAWRSASFYAVVLLVQLALVTRVQFAFLPERLAGQIGHNSEVLGLTLLICSVLQFARPWAAASQRLMRTILVFAVLMGIYLIMHFAVSAPTVATLDECFSGAAYVWLYAMLPKRARIVPVVMGVVLLAIVVFYDTTFIIEQAESLIPLLIAPLALDVADRTILDPTLPDRPGVRVVWIVILAVIGLTLMVAARWARQDLDSWFTLFIDYGQRASEAYWAWILVHLYFGWIMPPRLRASGRRPVTS